MARPNIDISEFRDEYGAPLEFVPADKAIYALKDCGLPPILFDYWKEYGFSKYLGGYFQLVNPLDYEHVITEWIKGTAFEGIDRFFALRMDAFGDLQVWGARLGNIFDISVSYNAIYKTDFMQEAQIRDGKGDILVDGLIYRTLSSQIDKASDDPRVKLFFQARDQLGTLGPNQIYALVPSAPLGGQMQLENLQIVDAPDYLALLPEFAQVREMTIQDLARAAFGDTAAQSL